MAKQKPITPPVPLDTWYRDVKTVEELRALLASDAFLKAAATLKELAGPSYNTLQDAESNGMRHAWFAGYRDALNDLNKLANTPTKNQPNEIVNEWTHIE